MEKSKTGIDLLKEEFSKTNISESFMIKKKITYEINNYSGVILLDLLKDCYKYSLNTHHKHRKREYLLNRELIGCYFLHDEHKNIIYIGKSLNCIRSRLISHICSEISEYLSKVEKDKLSLKRIKSKYFSFTQVDRQMIDFVERGLINEYQPILNIQFVNV